MSEKNSYVVVSVKLPVDIYQVLDRKAKASDISVGALLSAFIVASIKASLGDAAKFVVRTIHPKRVRQEGRRAYVRVRDEDVPEMRAMVQEKASPDRIAERFGISRASALNWRRKILDEDQLTDAA
ncbi:MULTISPECIES: hypothetical protein [Microbacterium]|uniref:Uncharacterized protein n=1 Tax=Microbacterium hominis TaxID=162426 RepID=A0A2K9DIZ6_9MICO|nr:MULTISPECIES: hypothetical protein [Microbacterium]AUG29457.1 hypothetical protein CXR34_08255 [Microbacterium hominis]EPD84155.1 hypothetical protein HMPREF1529_02195 [Microbacterium sp. oral taxon 186 str. F0373]